jgi:drug/metabolite transporter (DMT)-like permease
MALPQQTLASRPAALSGNLAGILAMVASSAFFIINDVLVKIAGADLPVGEILFIRGAMAVVLVAAFAFATGAFRITRSLATWPLAVRTAGEIGATCCFVFGLMHMPIAETFAITQFGPLLLTAASAVFLGERVGWRRWSAAVAGLAGVLMILSPGSEAFSWYALLPMASVFFGVVRDLATRRMAAEVPSVMLAVVTAGCVMLAGLAQAPFQDWRAAATESILELLAAAAFLAAGYVSVIFAVRSGELSAIAPFRYSSILFAIIAGLLVWGEMPDAIALTGMGIVTAAGLYTFMRERKLAALRHSEAGAE